MAALRPDACDVLAKYLYVRSRFFHTRATRDWDADLVPDTDRAAAYDHADTILNLIVEAA
jgi:hypothetical protein